MLKILVVASHFNATYLGTQARQLRDELSREGRIDATIAGDGENNVPDTFLHGAAQQFNPESLT